MENQEWQKLFISMVSKSPFQVNMEQCLNIQLNGVAASLDTNVKNNDVIEVTQGEDGKPAELSIHDLD